MRVPDRQRLTATPNCMRGKDYPGALTVWVEPGTLWLRPAYPVDNPDAYDSEGWARLTEADWRSLRATVDKYFEAITAQKAPGSK